MRLRYWFGLYFLWLTVVLATQTAWAKPDAQKFLDGVSLYKSSQYKEAALAFKELADGGVASAKLFYNLGNAYLKAGDLGRAILWYERARVLNGNDPDLLFNLSYARSLTKDTDSSKGPALYRILFFWNYQLSRQTILILAFVVNSLLWFTLLLRMFIKSKKRPLGIAALVLVLPTLIFVFTTIYNYYETTRNQIAVILPEKVSVRSGFSEQSTELFVLHAGTKVHIQKQRGDFLRISYSKDKIGWIKQVDAGRIYHKGS
jgi:tetratricopeptide (TPR) repeat protein